MKTFMVIAAGLALLGPGPAFARDISAAPNWDAALAARSAAVPATRDRVAELFDLLRAGDQAMLLARLDDVIAGRALAQPVRDAILFEFAVGLADFEGVDPGLIERLRAVEPWVLVPHEERADLGVPLFNIGGAAEGVYQLGMRREGRALAARLAEGPADDWVEAFLRSRPADRAGFGDALEEVPQAALQRILAASLARQGAAPELTPIAGKAALLLGDTGALAAVTRTGAGPELARILEAAASTLPPANAAALLQSAITEAPAANAALAIAQIYPRIPAHPEATDLLFEQLGNADLGAAAALALARSGNGDVHARLRRLAESGPEPAATRARTALGIAASHPDQRS